MNEDNHYMEMEKAFEEEQKSISCEEYAIESEVMSYAAA